MNRNSYLTYLNDMFGEPASPILFIDFDGTISKKDVIDAILEQFADKRWLEIEEKWISGEIGSRECLQKQFALVRATPAELNEFLDALELDEGFPLLLEVCRAANIPVHIVSDGFDYYIRRMLGKAIQNPSSSNNIGVWANNLIPIERNQWRGEFPYFRKICRDGCATCKPRVMRINNLSGAPNIFVGDGLSDRFAAQAADAVFAKKKLAEFCAQNRMPHAAFTNLAQVAESFGQAFESPAFNLFEEPDGSKPFKFQGETETKTVSAQEL